MSIEECASELIRKLRPRTREEILAYRQREKVYYQSKMQKISVRNHIRRDALRKEMLFVYGSKCAYCGENDEVVLLLDHINDDGWEERIMMGRDPRTAAGHHTYKYLKDRGWPKGRHQLLCANCSARKEYARRMRERAERLSKIGDE